MASITFSRTVYNVVIALLAILVVGEFLIIIIILNWRNGKIKKRMTKQLASTANSNENGTTSDDNRHNVSTSRDIIVTTQFVSCAAESGSKVEYITLREVLADFTEQLAGNAPVITQLSARLFSAGLIPKTVHVTVSGINEPYERANKLCSSVLTILESHSTPKSYISTLYVSLKDVGLFCIADKLKETFGKNGGDITAFQDRQFIPNKPSDESTLPQPLCHTSPILIKLSSKDEVACHIEELHFRFSSLVVKIRTTFIQFVSNGQLQAVEIAYQAEAFLSITIAKGDINDIFSTITPHFDFLNVSLLDSLVNQFIPGNDVQAELVQYMKSLDEFSESSKLKDVREAIRNKLSSTMPISGTSAHQTKPIVIKLAQRWEEMTLKNLKKVLHHYFGETADLFSQIRFEYGSLLLKLQVPPSCSKSLVKKVKTEINSMKHLAVIEIATDEEIIPIVNEIDCNFENLLHESAKAGNSFELSMLLKLGANPNSKNEEGKSALEVATEAGHTAIVEEIITGGATLFNGFTALILASQNGNEGEVMSLLKANVNVSAQNDEGKTALIVATQFGQYSIVELLLQQKHIDVNISDNSGYTALDYACQMGYTDLVKLLLKFKDQIYVIDQPLMLASKYGHLSVIKLLYSCFEISEHDKLRATLCAGLSDVCYWLGVQCGLDATLTAEEMKTSLKNNLAGTMCLPSLGRSIQLGMLYDCRSDYLIPEITLWDNATLKAAVTTSTPQPNSFFQIVSEDKISKKMSNLGVEANLSLSVLSGLVKVSGAAEYLNDRRPSRNDYRVTLEYSYTSESQYLALEQLATSKIQHFDVFEKQMATHVVTGVLHGAEAFFIFDREVKSSENRQNVGEIMEDLITAAITESAALSNHNQKEANQLKCKLYGDLQSNPHTFKDAVKVYKELPLSFKKKGGTIVPKKFWLYPLSKFENKAAHMVREISTSLIIQVQKAIDVLNDLEIRCHDLVNTKIYNNFSSLNKQVSWFQEMIKEHETDLMKRLSAIIPSIRGAEAEEQELASLIETYIHQSPFNSSSLEEWITTKEEEIKIIMNLDVMKAANGVKFAGDYEAALSNAAGYDYVLSFEFKVVKDDPFLQNMYSFLCNKKIIGTSLQSSSKISPWFETNSILQDLNLKSEQFTSFVNANAGNSKVMFIVTDCTHSNEDASGAGAVIMHYEFGTSVGHQFDPPTQPVGKPEATILEHKNSVLIQWKAPEYGLSIDNYKVSYSESSDSWATHQITKGNETVLTINDLKPETCYIFKVCAETKLGHSEYSEVSNTVKTKSLLDLSLQNIIADSDVITSHQPPPTVYKLKTRPAKLQKYRNIEFGMPSNSNKPTRVLLLFGAAGAGKKTLINGIVNYYLGVTWEHNFRFKLIHDECTQTQVITTYTLYWQECSPINCNLTIINTRFGDTHGLKRNEIRKHVRELLIDYLDELHAVCFVIQASSGKLSPNLNFFFETILSIFGKDIKSNFFFLPTFADGLDPPVMEAVREANIPHADFFSFNNSALFVDPKMSDFASTFWYMSYASFTRFFIQIEQASSVSLQLTQQVFEKHQKLEDIVCGILHQINVGLSKVNALEEKEKNLCHIIERIEANRDHTYDMAVTKQKRIELPPGASNIDCLECHYTCHAICAHRDIWNCVVMDDGGRRNACCTVCPGRCSWKEHIRNYHYFELYEEKEPRTFKEILERYNQAKSDEYNQQILIETIKRELQQLLHELLVDISKVHDCVKQLHEISLNPNQTTDVDPLIKTSYDIVHLQAELSKFEDSEEMKKQDIKSQWEEIIALFSNRQ